MISFKYSPFGYLTIDVIFNRVSTAGAATESKLKDRVVFGARFVTRDGRDALRELFGFFFLSDSTLTVYEFRIFGKT